MLGNKDDLLFLPLGGSNEIGMNVNLYRYKGKWLMIDLGAGFADERLPGIDMMAPDLSFIREHKKDFLGLVLTHAHEDHVGSVGYLWHELQCPIFATPFTSIIAAHKLREYGHAKKAKITQVKPGKAFEVGPFSMELIPITHSIPEMNGVAIHTDYGTIFHTGDWKLDPDPIIQPLTNEKALKALGEKGVLAMVCDSTNIFNEGHSGSEGDLQKNISGLIAETKGLVAVTTFASNIARVKTIARAAAENGRRVALAGLSLWRMTDAAREAGYMDDIEPFLSDQEAMNLPRGEALVICTGCQGDYLAAMNKIISGIHPKIRLVPGDSVIFSSKIIPGNEKRIFRMFNLLVHLGVEVYTEKDHYVHVSGHPAKQEMQQMYEWVKPKIAVPVHGEPTHLHEHARFSLKHGAEQAIQLQNGEVIKLAPGKAESLGFVKSGYLAVDGRRLIPSESEVMKSRRRLQREGIIFLSLVMDRGGNLVTEPEVNGPGALDEEEDRMIIRQIEDDVMDVIESQRNTSDDNIIKVSRRAVGNVMKGETGKNPRVLIHIARV